MSESTQPNVIFIVADQMKWSALRMYSEIGIEAPSLERLAREGVRFANGITPHPLCVPARVSMMTSRYAHSTGSRRNETLMPPGELHAFRIWKDLGYSTGLVGKNHCFDHPSDIELIDVLCELPHLKPPNRGITGPTRGMEWIVPEDVIKASHETRINMPEQSPAISYAVTDHDIEGYSTNAVTSQSEAFIERAASGDTFGNGESNTKETPPFALFVSYNDPHHPLEVPRKYAEMVPAESITLPPLREGEFSGTDSPERNRVLYEILSLQYDQIGDVRNAVAVYLAMVRMVDDGVGRILDKLDELNLRDNTIVVFTADHGDFAGEHNMLGKGGVFYDAMVRVPYIVSWPGGGVPQGELDTSLVNTVDILPTLLQLSGVADFMKSPDVRDGDELSPAGPRVREEFKSDVINSETLRRFQGKPLPTVTSAEPRKAAYSEYGTGGPPFTMDLLNQMPATNGFATVIDSLWMREAEGRRKMVRTEAWKYVTDSDEGPTYLNADAPYARKGDELYDLNNDPWELTNVAHNAENKTVISMMRALLADWMMETEDPNPVPMPVTIGRQHKAWFDTDEVRDRW